jgi:hypothetical protein
MVRMSVCGLVLGLAACTSSPDMQVGPGSGGGNPTGTIVSGTLTFGPMIDVLTKFQTVPVTVNGSVAPQLRVLDERAIGTGSCSMLVLPDGATMGAAGWEFAAPSGKRFSHLNLKWSVYVDPRSDNATIARAVLLTNDGQLDLTLQGASGTQTATPAEIDAAIAGTDRFAIVFELDNPDYTSQLGRIFAQALRQCPGDTPPFSISATFQ